MDDCSNNVFVTTLEGDYVIKGVRGEFYPCQFMHWVMGLPRASRTPRACRSRLAGNAVVGLQARLMLQRGLTAINDTRGTL